MALSARDAAPEPTLWLKLLQAAFFLAALYLFFSSIDLMSAAFKLFGKDLANQLILTASDPLAGLFIGFLCTSLVQSSSMTTSIVVGIVAAGTLPLPVAIPIVMGANIGTTVTNTIVSLGHVTRPDEFRRAFAAATVHDFFNILAVIIMLPIEVMFHPIEKVAIFLQTLFFGIGGMQLASPLKAIIKPFTHMLTDLIPIAWVLLIVALGLLFFSLSQMVRIMRKAMLSRIEAVFDRVLFRNDLAGFSLGLLLTASVQSSSATTSLVVPLAGTGVLTVRKIFPYTLGANVGTTITAILASLSTGNAVALTVALAHLTFNIFGIVIFYPLKSLPINLALKVGDLASRSKRSTAMAIGTYVTIQVIPLIYILTR